jgi:hypothetical protein
VKRPAFATATLLAVATLQIESGCASLEQNDSQDPCPCFDARHMCAAVGAFGADPPALAAGRTAETGHAGYGGGTVTEGNSWSNETGSLPAPGHFLAAGAYPIGKLVPSRGSPQIQPLQPSSAS